MKPPLLLRFCLSHLQKERIREKFVAALQREFAGRGLRFSRGEQAECVTATVCLPFVMNFL